MGGRTLIGVVVGIVLIFNLGVPVVTSSITDANLTGTNLTLAQLVPTLLIIAGILGVAAWGGMD